MKKSSPLSQLRGRVAVMSPEIEQAILRAEGQLLDHDDFVGDRRDLHACDEGAVHRFFPDHEDPYPDGSCASRRCLEPPFRSGFCRRHHDIKLLGYRRWLRQNWKGESFRRYSLIQRRNRIRLRLCPDCGQDAQDGQQRCQDDRERSARTRRSNRAKAARKVVTT